MTTDAAPSAATEKSRSEDEFASTLNAAIRASRLSLERIRARLSAAGAPVSIATLSYWQTGRSLPARATSMSVVRELESILSLDPGTLMDLVSEERTRRSRDLKDWEKLIPSHAVAFAIVEELGLSMTGGLTRISMHDTIRIDDQRRESTELSRQVLRADVSGVSRWPVVYAQDAEPGVVPRVAGVSGCSVGEVIEIPERNLLVAEMVLHRTLERGELTMVELITNWGPSNEESFRIERSHVSTTREVVMEAQFHKNMLPTRVRPYSRMSMEEDEVFEATDIPVHRGLAQRVVLDAPPGIHGFRWYWD